MDESTCSRCGGALSVPGIGGLCPACFAMKGLISNTQNRAARHLSDWQPPLPGDIAALFPELTQIELVGRGGMGAVYRARQRQLDRDIAVKILPPQLLHDITFAERFSREAQAMARLNHPNIVTIHDFGRRGELFYLIMEFVDGVTLRQLTAASRVKAHEAMNIVRQICEALQFAHEQGIVHRDIKPENILVSRRGQVKIADFGLAKLVGFETGSVPISATTSAVGTPLYMAPEQVHSPASVDHRADVYSLGVVMYELLTGDLPDQELDLSPGAGDRLNELVSRALSRDPAERYHSIQDFRTQLDTLTTGDWLVAAPQAPPPPADPPVEKGRRSSVHKTVLKDVRASLAVPARGIRYVAIANMIFLVATAIPALISFIATAPEKVIDNPLALQLSLPWWATGAFIYTVLSIALNAMVYFGARRMAAIRSYGWSMASAIMCLFAAPANVVGAVFGVWAIVVLTRPHTREAFGVRPPNPRPSRSPRGLRWLPMITVRDGGKHLNILNYTLLASSVWLLSEALVSLLLLGKPANGYYALLLIVPAIAAAQSLTRHHRRLPQHVLEQAPSGTSPLVARLIVFASLVVIYLAAQHLLLARHLAAADRATTQPAKRGVVDRLHITVPKVP